jgi:hypothetical protein
MSGITHIRKSRLLKEFSGSVKKTYVFSGLLLDIGLSAKIQRQAFMKQFERYFGLTPDPNNNEQLLSYYTGP